MALPKNIRNYKAYLEKKKRGPVKTFFHITKNENVPAIEKKGLLANHPNANINSAFQPFRKHGSTGGGVWVTTEPTAFPVYGTTIGGRSGDASARADALTTFKIDIPKAELPKMLAVQDPYGKNILRKGNDPKAIKPFSTWLGNDVPTTVFLNDMQPAWLKNLGYVEERAPIHQLLNTHPKISDLRGGWDILQEADDLSWLRALTKGDLRDYSGLTGHGHGFGTYDKSPQRFVEDYLNRNRPITQRLPIFPKPFKTQTMASIQRAKSGQDYFKTLPFNLFRKIRAAGAPDLALDLIGRNKLKRYSADFIPAINWTNDYRSYVKPGEDITQRSHPGFRPGAISRGIGGQGLPSIKERNFDWNRYNKLISEGDNPRSAAFAAQPNAKLDWDNIIFHNVRGYGPRLISAHDFDALSEGAISRGMPPDEFAEARARRAMRKAFSAWLRGAIAPYNRSNADIIHDQFKLGMPDDEIRELSRLELRNNKDNKRLSEVVRNWSRLENSDILKLRQRALNKIKGSWLYDYLTKNKKSGK